MKMSKFIKSFLLLVIMIFAPVSNAHEKIDWELQLTDKQKRMLSPYKETWSKLDKKLQHKLTYRANLLLELKKSASKSEEEFQNHWGKLSYKDKKYITRLFKKSKYRNFRSGLVNTRPFPSPVPTQPVLKHPDI